MSGEKADSTNRDVRATAWLRPPQVEAMRDACYDSTVPHYLRDRNDAIVAFLYDTGLRASEAVAVDVDDLVLDADPSELRVPAHYQKGGAPTVTIDLGKWGADSTRSLRRYLGDRWKDTDALFPTRSSDRMTRRSLLRTVKKTAERAEIRPHLAEGGRGAPGDVTAHTLRHSVAYRVVREEGGQLEDVQLRLRHKNLTTTDRVYGHLRPR